MLKLSFRAEMPRELQVKLNERELRAAAGKEAADELKARAMRGEGLSYDPGKIAESIKYLRGRKTVQPTGRHRPNKAAGHRKSKLSNPQLAQAHLNKGRGGILQVDDSIRRIATHAAQRQLDAQIRSGKARLVGKGKQVIRSRG